jgi:hypothetical protein
MHVPQTVIRRPASPQPRIELPHHNHAGVLSRRAFMGTTAVLAGAVVGSRMLAPMKALGATRANAAPKPTTNIVNLNGTDFHLTFFGPGIDPSTIADFNGFVGVADVQGTGTATNPDGSTEQLLFDTDMRFMSGVYVGQDGAVHKGAFGFV